MKHRKIEAMHSTFGKDTSHKCKECCNLDVYNYRGKRYRKCLMYGSSYSEATDWANSYIACGRFNVPFNEFLHIPLIKICKCRILKREESPMEGQIGMGDK